MVWCSVCLFCWSKVLSFRDEVSFYCCVRQWWMTLQNLEVQSGKWRQESHLDCSLESGQGGWKQGCMIEADSIGRAWFSYGWIRRWTLLVKWRRVRVEVRQCCSRMPSSLQYGVAIVWYGGFYFGKGGCAAIVTELADGYETSGCQRWK